MRAWHADIPGSSLDLRDTQVTENHKNGGLVTLGPIPSGLYKITLETLET